MPLSRKSQKNIKKLKANAENLWEQQIEVLENAGKAVQDARVKLAQISDAEIKPRFDSAWNQVKPAVDKSVQFTKNTANQAKEKIVSQLLPAVSSAISSAATLVELSRDPRVKAALNKGKSLAKDAAKTTSKAISKPEGSGFGKYALIGLGVLAVAGVAWATWQALKFDEGSWPDDGESDNSY